MSRSGRHRDPFHNGFSKGTNSDPTQRVRSLKHERLDTEMETFTMRLPVVQNLDVSASDRGEYRPAPQALMRSGPAESHRSVGNTPPWPPYRGSTSISAR